jgi:hypothetical protein
MGAFMRAGWTTYAACLPASGVLYFLMNFFAKMPSEESEFSPIIIVIGATLLQSLGLMLGVYLARRKAKRNFFEA